VRVVVLLPPAVICNEGLASEVVGPDAVAIVVRLVIPSNPVLLMAIRDVLEVPGYIVNLFGVAFSVRLRGAGAFL